MKTHDGETWCIVMEVCTHGDMAAASLGVYRDSSTGFLIRLQASAGQGGQPQQPVLLRHL